MIKNSNLKWTHERLGFPAGTGSRWPACRCRRWETRVWSLGREDPQEGGMTAHSRILAWRIPWTEEPGGLQSSGSRKVGHDWSDWASTRGALSDVPQGHKLPLPWKLETRPSISKGTLQVWVSKAPGLGRLFWIIRTALNAITCPCKRKTEGDLITKEKVMWPQKPRPEWCQQGTDDLGIQG